MFEDLAIDTSIFTWRYSPDLRGVFEPVSRIMFLNVTDQEFEEMRSDPDVPASQALYETFWHETYHCLQVYTTGYLYTQFQQLVKVLGDELFSEKAATIKFLLKYLRGKVKNAARSWMSGDL